jgi:hypothetical protein
MRFNQMKNARTVRARVITSLRRHVQGALRELRGLTSAPPSPVPIPVKSSVPAARRSRR